MNGSTLKLNAGKIKSGKQIGLVGGALVFLLTASAFANVEAEQNLKDPDAKVRAKAAQELGEGGNPAYVTVLADAVQDQDEAVRMAVVKSLIRLGTEASLEPLLVAVQDSIPEIREWAINGLVNFYLPGYVDTGFGGFFRSMKTRVGSFFSDIDTVVVDPDVQASEAVIRTLGQTVSGAPYVPTRVQAARALGILRARAAVPELVEAAFDNEVNLILEVLLAFQKIKDTSVGPRISFLLNYPQKNIQRSTATTLGLLRTQSTIPELRQLLENSEDKDVRVAVLDALAFMPQVETGPVFLGFLRDREKRLRAAAALGLGRLDEVRYPGALEQAREQERDSGVQLALDFALAAHGNMDYLEEIVSELSSRVRRGEARPYLIELARKQPVREALRPYLYSTDPEIRQNLCMVFAASGTSTSISYLEVLLDDSNSEVAQEANRAIRILRSRGM